MGNDIKSMLIQVERDGGIGMTCLTGPHTSRDGYIDMTCLTGPHTSKEIWLYWYDLIDWPPYR